METLLDQHSDRLDMTLLPTTPRTLLENHPIPILIPLVVSRPMLVLSKPLKVVA